MAIIVNIEFTTSTLNPSLQVGDNIYFSIAEDFKSEGGFTTTNTVAANTYTPKLLGRVTNIQTNEQTNKTTVSVLDKITPFGDVPFTGSPYYSFSKSGAVNHNDLIGYYNEVKFVNNSSKLAKLFAVGTEVTENSK